MSLTDNQCSAIAQIIPVLMIAIVLEQRALIAHVHRLRSTAFGLLCGAVISCAGGLWVAVDGIHGGLPDLAGTLLVILVGALLVLLIASTWSALKVESRGK